MSGLVSIILPVYNGAGFLYDSIGSVFRQTYRNIELIAIDDGSMDSSAKILEHLKRTAPHGIQVRVMSQENHGICFTRNCALDMAKGDYILFMDQDDRLKKKYVETMVQKIEQEQADILIGGYELISENRKVLKRVTLDPNCPWSMYKISAPWGRIFRRIVIEKNHIRFMITKISEDYYFNMIYLSYCEKIAVTDYAGYGWTYRKASESHAYMSKASEDRNVLCMLSAVLRDMKEPNYLDNDLIEYMMIKHIIWYLLYTAKSMDKHLLKQYYARCMAWLKTNCPNYKQNPQLGIFTPTGEELLVRMTVFGSVLLIRAQLFYPFLRLYSTLD